MHSNSLARWEFMAGCQPFNSRSGGAQQLTCWMQIHGKMSAIQFKVRRCTATHSLDGNAWWGCQPFKSRSGGTWQLTSWMGIYGKMSAIQIEVRRHTATHSL